MTKEYCSVVDLTGTLLDPTKTVKAWYLIRKNRAKLLSKYPMKIQLFKVISPEDVNNDPFICGINDGSKHVGLAVVQQCKTRNKVVFKGTVEHRQDVKKLLDQRRNYRKVARYLRIQTEEPKSKESTTTLCRMNIITRLI